MTSKEYKEKAEPIQQQLKELDKQLDDLIKEYIKSNYPYELDEELDYQKFNKAGEVTQRGKVVVKDRKVFKEALVAMYQLADIEAFKDMMYVCDFHKVQASGNVAKKPIPLAELHKYKFTKTISIK